LVHHHVALFLPVIRNNNNDAVDIFQWIKMGDVSDFVLFLLTYFCSFICSDQARRC
jgi:hypothetical protein